MLCTLRRAFIIIIYLNLYPSICCGTLNYFCSFVWSEHTASSAYFPIGRWHFHWTMNPLWHNKFSWMFLKMCHKVNILCLLQLHQHCPLLPAVIWISSVCSLSSKHSCLSPWITVFVADHRAESPRCVMKQGEVAISSPFVISSPRRRIWSCITNGSKVSQWLQSEFLSLRMNPDGDHKSAYSFWVSQAELDIPDICRKNIFP